MHEDSKQLISRLLDNDLERNEARDLLQAMRMTPELRNTLKRYEAIGHALKTEEFLIPDADFATRVSEKLHHEPAYLLPRRRANNVGRYKIYAAAASIALFGIITEFNIKKSADFAVPAVALKQPLQVAGAEPRSAAGQTPGRDSINKQINDYLQAHNSSVYTNGQADFQPYARVTAYSQK